MVAPSRTATSTPRLSEYARHFVFPAGRITKTVWTRIEARGAELGFGFDWWQQQAGKVCFGYGADGKYVATVGGIGLSIGRQVGKTYFVLASLFILCILFPGLQVVWTSHHLRTTTKTLTTARGFARRKNVAPHVRAVRTSHGEGQVEFVNGSVIMFGARSQGFGRGFDEIDVEVFDEAQILDTKALEDMIAATNQARHPHGALLFFMGTPPRPTDPSEAFRLRRAEALSGETDDAVWLEIGAAPDSDPNDEAQWPLMNPSYPLRTPRESMLRLRRNLGDEDSWNREGRGVWDSDARLAVFGSGNWGRCQVASRPPDLAVGCLALAVSIDLSRASVVAAAQDDGRAYVKPLQVGPDPYSWVTKACVELAEVHDTILVVDGRGPAAVFIPALKEALGDRCRVAGTGDVLDACAGIDQAVRGQVLAHEDYPELTKAVEDAKKRDVGDRWAWGRRKSGGDISPLEAATLALWGLTNAEQPTVSAYETRGVLTV